MLTPFPRSRPRSRRALGTALRVGAGAAITVAINTVVLLVAVAVGFLAGQVSWSIAVAEGPLLVVSLGIGITMAVRRRSGLGAGVALGWVIDEARLSS